MKLLETCIGPVAYDERGGHRPVVLLSSGAHDHHDFDELRALLPAVVRSIAVDWPGHGASPLGEYPPSAMHFADLTEELVARLAPEGAVLLGNSVGGFAAARLAIRRPELVRGLVLIDSGGFVGRPLQVRLFCRLMGRPWFLRRIYPAFSAAYMRERTAADRRARATSIKTTRDGEGLRAVAGLWRSFASPAHDLRAGAARISAPTLVLWGRRDPVIPLKIGERLAETIAGARLATFDAGHSPHTSEPQAVASVLSPFLESVFAGAGAVIA